MINDLTINQEEEEQTREEILQNNKNCIPQITEKEIQEEKRKWNFSNFVKDKLKGKQKQQTIIRQQQNQQEQEEEEEKTRKTSIFEDPKKIKMCLTIAAVLLIVCIIGFIIYVIVSNKQTQQIILCKNSEIESCNEKINKMKKDYKETITSLETENNNLKQHIMSIHSPPPDDEDEEIEEFKQDDKPITIEYPIQQRQQPTQQQRQQQVQQRQQQPTQQKQQQVQQIYEDEQEEAEEQQPTQPVKVNQQVNEIETNDNEYTTEIPIYEDAPQETQGIQHKKRLTHNQMIKKALNNKCIETNNKKQQAIALQQKKQEEDLENYTKEEQAIATELGLNRNQDINEEKIKELIKEEDLKEDNEQQFDDAGIIDQSLILGAN